MMFIMRELFQGIRHIKSKLSQLHISYKVEIHFLGAISGSDEKDSTTVIDGVETFRLPQQVSVKDLHIGIPVVQRYSVFYGKLI